MKRSVFFLVAMSLISTLWCSNASAVGLGFYVDASGGSGESEWESDSNHWDIDTSGGATGFVLDTAPTNESVFNYRLNAGFAGQDWEDEDGITLESGGIYVENIFGVAMTKNERFRWWLGPLVRLGFYSGETDTWHDGADRRKVEVDYAEFGVGVVTGINININNRVTLAPSVGFRYCGFSGNGTTKETIDGVHYSDDEDIEGSTTSGFVNFAVLF